MFIAIGLAAGVFSSLLVVALLFVFFAIKTAGEKRKEAARRVPIEHPEFSFRMHRDWTLREIASPTALFLFEQSDGGSASIQIISIPVWRGGLEIAPENIAQYLPGSSVRHQRDEIDGAEAVIGFSQEKNLGIWHCVAGVRHIGKDYIVHAQGPDREALIGAVFVIRKTWRWK